MEEFLAPMGISRYRLGKGHQYAGGSRMSRRLIWVVVAFAAVSLALNLMTPSRGERAIWAPAALLLLISSAMVAMDKSSQPIP